MLAGYTTGDAKSQSWMRKGIVYWKSRYLTLSAESHSPTANEVSRARRMNAGSRTIAIVGTTRSMPS